MPPASSRSLLPPEAQLLLLTAGDPANDAALRTLLDAKLDWTKLGGLVQQEAATPIVWHRLQRIGVGRMPPHIESAWRRLAMVSDFQALPLEKRLHEAVHLLASREIEVMLLKGSALAHTTYASFADRPMSDLDLLVRTDRAREAWLLLQQHGWSWPSDRWPAHRYDAHHHLPPLLNARGGAVRVELHTALFPGGHPFRLRAETLWSDATPVSVDGQRALTPAPIHQLLHLCIHLAWSHMLQWGSWRAFRDVGRLVRRHDVPWESFTRLAHESRGATCCFWTLRLARNLTGAPIPDDVFHALRPPLAEFVLDALERHYALQLFPSADKCPSTRLDRRLWQLGIAPRWSRHGAARPWHGQDKWLDPSARSPISAKWPRRLTRHARRVAESVGYLARTVIAAP